MSIQIRKDFMSRWREVTPASARQSVRVFYAPFSRDAVVSARCSSILSEKELMRRDRLVGQRDKALFEQRRAFRRVCAATALGPLRPLSEIVFEETEQGRPALSDSPELWFSFSSCRSGLLGAWSSTHAIGVDLEDSTKDLEARELARDFFSPAEAEAVEASRGRQRLWTFYRFWTLKEAALKSIGEGLPRGMHVFEFQLKPELRVVGAPQEHGGPDRFGAHVIEGTDQCAALVTHRRT